MGKIRRDPKRKSELGARVAWLLDVVWDGNRSEMSRAVGCSHAVLSKIASGQQGPGRRVLSAIALHPKVNPAWLFSGEGEPLLAQRETVPAEGWPLPVAKQLLPGPPREYRDLLCGESFPIAGAFYRPTRYWLEIQSRDPIVDRPSQHVAAGDLLLMEADQAWRNQGQLVDQKLCVVCVRARGQAMLKLALVTFSPATFEDGGGLSADTFELPIDRRELIREIVLRERPGGGWEAQQRLMRKAASGEPGAKPTEVRNIMLSPISHGIALADILGVCLMTVRRC